MTSGGNNFNHFAENQLTKFSARVAGDFSDAAGDWEMAPICGSLPRDAGGLVGLCPEQFISRVTGNYLPCGITVLSAT